MPPTRRATPAPVHQATRALYEAMHRFDGAVAEALGIHRSDLRCLNALEHGPLPPRTIGERLGLTSGSVTALLDRLERAGLVERRADEADRRRWAIALTARAYPRVDREYARLGQAIDRRMAGFSAAERRRLGAALEALAGAFDEAIAGGSPPVP